MVVAALPPTVRMTPADRRLQQPLVLTASSGKLALRSRWQLGSETIVRCSSGRVVLDLAAAEFDDEVIDLELRCSSGRITVIVPHGVDVQMVDISGASGEVRNALGDGVGVPGLPLVRVSASTSSGKITLRRPREKKRRRGWFRRRPRS